MTLPTPETPAADDVARGLNYAYKPSLFGSAFEFRLGEDALAWRSGRGTGRIPYDRIARVRLSFRPVTMQTYRFVTEVWSPGTSKLTIVSSSWKGLVEQERRDADYCAFVQELHRRIAGSDGGATFDSGSMAILYWPGLAAFAVTTVTLVALTAQTLLTGAWTAAAVVGFFLAMFLWQAGNYFLRNVPRTYRSDAIPPQVLPRA
jgi:hypothetical protein